MSVAAPIVEAVPAPAQKTSTTSVSETERFARLRLARSHNVGPRTYQHLMRRFRTAEAALEALPSMAARGGRSGYLVCPEEDATGELEAAKKTGAKLLQIGDRDYPERLARIDGPPPALWMIGDGAIFQRPSVAIVGARNASALGLRTSRRLARELGSEGWAVVSGLARGIDTAAHEASLETGTLAVMAGGVDCAYPPENEELARMIGEKGALISECPIGMEPTSRHFPRRNRLISGLSDGVVLIEAAARSGSLITARFALEQGREAMACPGAPEDPRAAGCNALIRDGAALIRNAEDVVAALSTPALPGLAEDGDDFLFDADTFGDTRLEDDYAALADFEPEGADANAALSDQLLRLVGPQPVEIDEIARQCGATPAELSLSILELELAGRLEIITGGMIARTSADA